MYLEFHISEDDDLVSQFKLLRLRQKLVEWRQKWHINYSSKTHKRTLRVAFDQDEIYSFFLMTWDPEQDLFIPTIKDPMKIDRTR